LALLTVAQARAFLNIDESELSDANLQLLLDGTEDDITDAVGPVGNVTELMSSGPGPYLMLSRRASAIVSVTEGDDALAADDYQFATTNGRLIERLDDGTNPDSRWRSRVAITYTPTDDTDRRKTAQIGLLQIARDVYAAGATTSERIGDWSETYTTSEETQARRIEVLSTLKPTTLVLL
jgi:hypothetical protein